MKKNKAMWNNVNKKTNKKKWILEFKICKEKTIIFLRIDILAKIIIG